MSLQNEWNESTEEVGWVYRMSGWVYRMSGMITEWVERVYRMSRMSTEWVEYVYRMSGIRTEWMEWVYRMSRIENLQIFCRFQFSLNVSDISINGLRTRHK